MSKPVQKKATASRMPIRCDRFDIGKFTFSEFDDKRSDSKAQMIAYPRYEYSQNDNSSPIFQTGEITITQYGLPRISEYYKTDDQRNFIKVPLDPNQDSCRQLEKCLRQIDEYTEKNKTAIMAGKLAKYSKLYEYQPIVRDPAPIEEISDDEEEENAEPKEEKEQRERYRYCKMKLNVNFQDQSITTGVFVKKNDGSAEPVNVKTATDLEEYFGWNSKVRFIVMANKLWASRNKDSAGKRKFGVSLKIIQMEVTPSERNTSVGEAFKKYAFINFDDDEQEATVEETQSVDVKETKQSAKPSTHELDEDEDEEKEEVEDADGGDDDDEDEDEEEEEEDDEEEEEPPKPARKRATPAPAPAKAQAPSKSRTARK